jgi:hypothetical protein
MPQELESVTVIYPALLKISEFPVDDSVTTNSTLTKSKVSTGLVTKSQRPVISDRHTEILWDQFSKVQKFEFMLWENDGKLKKRNLHVLNYDRTEPKA